MGHSSMQSCPLVSILIPSFNREKYLRKSIDGALNQSYRDIEVIVVDGASKDRTVDILKSYGNRIKWISEPDQGESDAYNKGVRLSQGEIICFLPSDDMLLPNAVEVAIQEFQTGDDHVGMVNGDAFLVDEQDHIIGFVRAVPLSAYYLTNIDVGRVIQPSTFLRRWAIQQAGGWDISVRYANDLDLWIRVLRNYSCRYVQTPLSYVRRHSSSLTVSQFKAALVDAYKIRRKYGGLLLSPATLRMLKVLLKYVLLKRM